MSTRCGIILKDDRGNKIHFYHHHDGYPAGVGSDLTCFVKNNNGRYHGCDIFNFEGRLIKGIDSPYFECKDDEYEKTSALRSDIDYLYVITFKSTGEAGRYRSDVDFYKVLRGNEEYEAHVNALTTIDGVLVAPISQACL